MKSAKKSHRLYLSFACALAFTLMACGGGGGGGDKGGGSSGPTTYPVSATTSGLVGTLSLSTPFGPDVEVGSNGTVALGQVAAGANYSVTLARSPAGQNCTVANGNGVLVAPGANIQITCRTLPPPPPPPPPRITLTGERILLDQNGDYSGTFLAQNATGFRVIEGPIVGTLTVATDGSGRFSYNGPNAAYGYGVRDHSFTVVATNGSFETAPVTFQLIFKRVHITDVRREFLRFDENFPTVSVWQVTISGWARADANAGFLLATTNPNSGPVTHTCSNWNGVHTVNGLSYCYRRETDSDWTRFESKSILNDYTLPGAKTNAYLFFFDGYRCQDASLGCDNFQTAGPPVP